MSKIVILIIAAWVIRSVLQSFKKAFAEAKKELAEKLRQAEEAQRAQAQTQPAPVQAEDPRQALLRMLEKAGVSPTVTKVVESTLDYDDDADESATDYDDDADESSTDYDDNADESGTDYDDTPPAAPVVYAPPPAPVVYATPDDATSNTVNQALRAELAAHVKPTPAPRAPVHGLDSTSVKSLVLVRDSVIMETLLRRYPRNPLFDAYTRSPQRLRGSTK